MNIIFRFSLKSIKEKKFRTFLILFAIAVSSALFFASSAISGTIEKIYVNKLSSSYGNSNVIIHSGDKSPSKYFYMNKIQKENDKIDYAIGSISEIGLYKINKDETVSFNLRGFNFNELQLMNPISFMESSNDKNFSGKKIIISKFTSQKYNKNVGDSIELEINGAKYKFTVWRIAGQTGFFSNDGKSVSGIVPLEALNSIMSVKGMVSVVYIKSKDSIKKEEIIQDLKPVYKDYEVESAINDDDLKQQVSSFTTPFMMMTIVVLCMSMFITYTAFKVIAMEKLPAIGTFRSIGATKRMTDLILIIESLCYGVIGGIIGCGLGIGILYIMTWITTPDWMKGNSIQIHFSILQLLIAFVLAVFISFISAILPIIMISKLPVKDIVLNEVEKENKKNKLWKLILGIILLGISFGLPNIAPKSFALYIDGLCMVLAVSSVVVLVPFITNIFIKIFEKVYIFTFGNEGVLAAKNLRENKSLLNNISLLAIGISALLMINTVSYSVGVEVLDAYAKFNVDIEMWGNMLDKNTERLVQNVDGVSDTYGVYSSSVKVADSNRTIDSVEGVATNKYLQFYDQRLGDNPDEIFQKLNEDRNILLTDSLLSRLGLKIGDYIALEMGKNEKQYKIIGAFNSVMYNGNYALVGEKYIKNDMGIKYYSAIYVKTNKNPQIVLDNIKNKLQTIRLSLMTKEEMETENRKSNEQMFNVLNAFSIMALVIGIFGVLNNLLISFMERKRFLAIFRSVGMSKLQTIKVIFIESLSGGIVGGTVGIFAGSLMIKIVPKVSEAMNLPLEINYLWTLFVYAFIGGIIINVAASIIPAFKSSKLNIIEAIKYE
ncbi:MAG: FtsX-like permease family protein [Clostridium sp.]|uniref:ABC transporter permease n=1 Tax=Clostridium sp. TaxID=1506 RepID=UPI0039EA8143